MTERSWPTCPECGSDQVFTECEPELYCECDFEWHEVLGVDGRRVGQPVIQPATVADKPPTTKRVKQLNLSKGIRS